MTMDSKVKPPMKNEKIISRYLTANLLSIGNWLFLLGSLVFTFDTIIEIFEGITLHSIFHIVACLLFTIGCVLFILDAHKSDADNN